jgi:predicted ferric reductase
MNPQFWWFLSRASGIVSWALLSATIVWGTLLTTRVLRQIDRPAWLLDLHRWLAGLAVVGVAVHMAALVADTFVEFGLADLFVPMASEWKPGPVAWGIIATYLLILIQGTSLIMKRLPRPLWRYIHMSSYAMFGLVSVHSFMAGTDASVSLFQTFGTVVITFVAVAFVIRVMLAMKKEAPRRVVVSGSGSRPSESDGQTR